MLKNDIKNVYIYVSDDLRYDYTPLQIKDLGISFKCVTQAPFSHPSFASLVTGVYAETHKVYNKLIDRITGPTFFSFKKFNTGYWAESKYDSLYPIFNYPRRVNIEMIKEPFILLERSLDTHAPFGSPYEDVPSFYKAIGDDYKKMKKYYSLGIKNSTKKFFKRIDILKDREILDNTLIIFTSDHGELFDEYNRRGHELPLCPELVYVPLIFIHPSLEPKKVSNTLPRTIDVLPTICDIFSIYKSAYFDGESILQKKNKYCISSCRTFDISRYIEGFPIKIPLYNGHSIWDYDNNGIVKLEGSLKPCIGGILDTIYMRTSQFHNWKKHKTYGKPDTAMYTTLTKYVQKDFFINWTKWNTNSLIFKKN
ncbi:MAG: sulfatase-like hydrolase/transferase [Candidatus Thermoplasmatota archaeon]|nr:sulfatase-like hydrolase/transferase [Candidatus Thermoplasmatota archaeon]